jgi:hypothetical protein
VSVQAVPDPEAPLDTERALVALADRSAGIERALATLATEVAAVRSEVRVALAWRPTFYALSCAFLGAGVFGAAALLYLLHVHP